MGRSLGKEITVYSLLMLLTVVIVAMVYYIYLPFHNNEMAALEKECKEYYSTENINIQQVYASELSYNYQCQCLDADKYPIFASQ